MVREADSPLAAAIIERVTRANPHVRPIRARYEPAVGALFLALEQAGFAIDDSLRARLTPTLPPASLFET